MKASSILGGPFGLYWKTDWWEDSAQTVSPGTAWDSVIFSHNFHITSMWNWAAVVHLLSICAVFKTMDYNGFQPAVEVCTWSSYSFENWRITLLILSQVYNESVRNVISTTRFDGFG